MHYDNSTGAQFYESTLIDSLGKCPDVRYIYHTMSSSPIHFDIYSEQINIRCSSLTYYTTASCVLLDRSSHSHWLRMLGPPTQLSRELPTGIMQMIHISHRSSLLETCPSPSATMNDTIPGYQCSFYTSCHYYFFCISSNCVFWT
jgi:hypothetical protein